MIKELILLPLVGGVLILLVLAILAAGLIKKNRGTAVMIEISGAVQAGARSFLKNEYFYLGAFVGVIATLVGVLGMMWPAWGAFGWPVALAFVVGAVCTALAGYVGVAVATGVNGRTAEAAEEEGISGALGVALGGGSAMGLSVAGFSLIGLSVVYMIFEASAQALVGYALGTSVVALFARSCGGIYGKGADISAGISGTVNGNGEACPSDDDARNAAVIADQVGDNLAGGAGFAADLMESLAEAIVATIILAASLKFKTPEMQVSMTMLPLMVATFGAFASLIGIFYIQMFVKSELHSGLTHGLYLAAGLTLLGAWFLTGWCGLPAIEAAKAPPITRLSIFWSILTGFVTGALVNFTSGLYVSPKYRPARRISERSQSGAALTVIEGLRAGMRSCTIPALLLAGAVVIAWRQAGPFGLALAALGMMMTTGIVVAINAFAPITDNARGIAEMAHLDRSVREIIDNLHDAGNMLAAKSKAFASLASALVATALLMTFIHLAEIKTPALALTNPKVLAGLLFGGMIPYYFSSMVLRAVGMSAAAMIGEVRRQFREIPGIMEGKARPDPAICTEIATREALRGMLLPAGLAIVMPIVIGLTLGKEMLLGVLIGALITSLMTGTQMVNAGSAMDNAKQYIEEGHYGGRGSEAHKAAALGDRVGDPLKDAIGPSINILIKLMCVLALLIAPLL